MTLHDELVGLAAKATPGPWEVDGLRGLIFHRLDQLTMYAIAEMESADEDNAALIVALVNNLPTILSALNAADEVKRLRDALGTIAAGDVPISVSPDLAVRYEKFARAAIADRVVVKVDLAGVDELVGRLNAKAKYTDRAFDNHSLGEMYREAATALQSLAAQLAEAREENERLLARLAHAEDDCEDDCIYCEERRQEIARAALKGSQQ
jgi:hypothetical protein